MEELKKLLDIKQFDKIQEEDFQERFKEIANELLKHYCIKKGTEIYTFIEIEFYLYNANHRDIITYPRKAHAGDWFFHQSGLDICFGEDDINKLDSDESMKITKNDTFGGILIRGLRRVSDNKPILGPIKCCNELFDQFSAIKKEGTQYPYVEKYETHYDNTNDCARRFNFKSTSIKYKNIMDNIMQNESDGISFEKFKSYLNKNYRFYIAAEFNRGDNIKYPNKPTENYVNNLK